MAEMAAGSPPVQAWIARAREGDADAFGLLYDQYQPDILRYLIHRVRDRDLAEDLTQQVFLKAWQAIPRYEQRGVPFNAWLYRMAHNQMVDHFRTQRVTTDLEGIEIPQEDEAEDRVMRRELREHLARAMDRLSEDHRQVLALRALRQQIDAMGTLP